MGFSYSLNLFIAKDKNGCPRNLLSHAKNADKSGDKTREGYNNGYIDTPKEMEYFMNAVKDAYGIEFSFDGIAQGSLDKLKQTDPKAYNASMKRVKEQEDNIDRRRNEAMKYGKDCFNNVAKKYAENYTFISSTAKDGLYDATILFSPKRSMTLGQIKQEFGLKDGELIKQNPKLKDHVDPKQVPSWFDRVFCGAKTNYDDIVVPAGNYITIDASKCNTK